MQQHESNTIEFKENVTDVIKKEVIAFANTQGGTIYVGIADNGTPTGIKDPDKTMQQITNMIRDSIKPDITLFIKYELQKISGKDKGFKCIRNKTGSNKNVSISKGVRKR